MQSGHDYSLAPHSSNPILQSAPPNSTGPIPNTFGSPEGNLAASQAQIRREQERADASGLVAGLQTSENSHRPLISTSKNPQGHRESTPILKLHPDLLWRVFLLNADMLPVDVSDLDRCGEWDALNITRRTSQVSQQWRDLAINSPSLWARCIDLNRLNQKEPHWRNEVLRRTGESFLHIKGSIASFQLGIFFLTVLDTSWERIRALEVELDPSIAFRVDFRWGALQRPAPALQLFCLSFDDNVSDIFCTAKVPIFAGGHAPALVKLVLCDVGILFKMPSSRFFRIRHLEIGGPFTIPGLFEALSNMSRLEYLQVYQNPRTDTTPSPLPYIILSQLSHIHLDSTLDSCITMLEHITPAPVNVLTLYCPNITGLEMDNSRLSTALSRYTKSFFDWHIVSELSVQMTDSNFRVECKEDSLTQSGSTSASRGRLFFNIQRFPGRPIHPEMYDALLGVFSACRLTNVSTLSIHLTPCNYKPTSAGDMTFISSFSSVETLTLPTTEFLDILLAKFSDKCLFFPMLKTLKYAPFRALSDSEHAFDTIEAFLLQRQEVGVPIDLLIIKTPVRPSSDDRQFFENFPGLRVNWIRSGFYNKEKPWDREDAEVLAGPTASDSEDSDYEL